MAKQRFDVEMHCTACVMRLEGLEDKLPGIQQICANYQRQQLEVTYDPAQITETQIKTAAARMGYTLLATSA